MKKKTWVVGGVALTAAALMFSGTFAWISGVQEATNQFVQEDYDVALHDVLDGTPVTDGGSHQVNWTAGGEVNKDIWVSNEGSDDILVRVKLTETMKLRKGAEELVNVKDAVHGSEADTLHDYVTWTTGSVKTYDEWKALSKDEQHGSYWVLADDGYAYWMQPLAPSGEEDTAGAAGNTGLLLDAVTLKEGQEGAVEYTIQVEMDAIDAKLAGLTDEGATWTSDAAKALAAAAVYDPVQDAVDRVDAAMDAATTEYGKEKLQAARDAYTAAAAAEDPAVQAEKMHEGKWYETYAQVFEDPEHYGADNKFDAQFLYSKEYLNDEKVDVGPDGSNGHVYDCKILMFNPVDHIKEVKLASEIIETITSGEVNVYRIKGRVADGAFQYVSISKLYLKNLDSASFTAHTFDGLTANTVIIKDVDTAVVEAMKNREYGDYTSVVNFSKW